MRLGIATGYYLEDVDAEIVELVGEAADVLEGLGASVVDVDLPGASEVFEATNLIVRAEATGITGSGSPRSPSSSARTCGGGFSSASR